MLNDHIEIHVTYPSAETAEKTGMELVNQRLAACVQIDGPITSIYRWQNKTEKEKEWRLTIKTKAALFTSVKDVIRSCHPYEVPQIIAIPVTHGFDAYLNWIDQEVGV